MVSHQVALVTGASSGIGQATAELLAASGFTVFGTSRAPDQLARSYSWLPLDVRSDTWPNTYTGDTRGKIAILPGQGDGLT
jgi:NADP-dependent 3-hydroxy acid dehydrogenase YdfG